MRKMLFIIILVAGCSYSSKTKMVVKGDNIRTIYGKGKNAEMVIERKMDIDVLKKR